MSRFTDFLNLFMWDSEGDSEEEFNIDKALNDNWEKIDTKVKTHVNGVNEEINNFKTEIDQKIEDIQALPVGGTKGQVLTKQSETDGDANWEDIEANEVYIGKAEEAPETAKIIVEEDDFKESSTLSKAEVYVGAEEPVAGEKVWFNKDKNSIYVRNSNGVYEEFIKKSEEVYSTEEQRIGTWIDGKPLYRIIKEYDVSAKETQSNDISSIPYDTIFINFSKSFNRWDVNSSSSIIWYTSDDDKGNVWINYEKKLNILNSSNATRHYWITLEYTKTTD